MRARESRLEIMKLHALTSLFLCVYVPEDESGVREDVELCDWEKVANGSALFWYVWCNVRCVKLSDQKPSWDKLPEFECFRGRAFLFDYRTFLTWLLEFLTFEVLTLKSQNFLIKKNTKRQQPKNPKLFTLKSHMNTNSIYHLFDFYVKTRKLITFSFGNSLTRIHFSHQNTHNTYSLNTWKAQRKVWKLNRLMTRMHFLGFPVRLQCVEPIFCREKERVWFFMFKWVIDIKISVNKKFLKGAWLLKLEVNF